MSGGNRTLPRIPVASSVADALRTLATALSQFADAFEQSPCINDIGGLLGPVLAAPSMNGNAHRHGGASMPEERDDDE